MQGILNCKDAGAKKVNWRGPLVVWDFGGNTSKIFSPVYKVKSDADICERRLGVDGSVYVIADCGINY